MLLEEFKKEVQKAKEMELSEGVGIYIRTLPYISAKRYTDIPEEIWESKIAIRTRRKMINVITKRIAWIKCDPSSSRLYRTEVVLMLKLLYPKEYRPAYRLHFSKMDSGRVKFIHEVLEILQANFETDKQRMEELI